MSDKEESFYKSQLLDDNTCTSLIGEIPWDKVWKGSFQASRNDSAESNSAFIRLGNNTVSNMLQDSLCATPTKNSHVSKEETDLLASMEPNLSIIADVSSKENKEDSLNLDELLRNKKQPSGEKRFFNHLKQNSKKSKNSIDLKAAFESSIESDMSKTSVQSDKDKSLNCDNIKRPTGLRPLKDRNNLAKQQESRRSTYQFAFDSSKDDSLTIKSPPNNKKEFATEITKRKNTVDLHTTFVESENNDSLQLNEVLKNKKQSNKVRNFFKKPNLKQNSKNDKKSVDFQAAFESSIESNVSTTSLKSHDKDESLNCDDDFNKNYKRPTGLRCLTQKNELVKQRESKQRDLYQRAFDSSQDDSIIKSASKNRKRVVNDIVSKNKNSIDLKIAFESSQDESSDDSLINNKSAEEKSVNSIEPLNISKSKNLFILNEENPLHASLAPIDFNLQYASNTVQIPVERISEVITPHKSLLQTSINKNNALNNFKSPGSSKIMTRSYISIGDIEEPLDSRPNDDSSSIINNKMPVENVIESSEKFGNLEQNSISSNNILHIDSMDELDSMDSSSDDDDTNKRAPPLKQLGNKHMIKENIINISNILPVNNNTNISSNDDSMEITNFSVKGCHDQSELLSSNKSIEHLTSGKLKNKSHTNSTLGQSHVNSLSRKQLEDVEMHDDTELPSRRSQRNITSKRSQILNISDGQTLKRSNKSNDNGINNKSDKVLDESEILNGTSRRSQNISNSKTSNLPKDDSVKSTPSDDKLTTHNPQSPEKHANQSKSLNHGEATVSKLKNKSRNNSTLEQSHVNSLSHKQLEDVEMHNDTELPSRRSQLNITSKRSQILNISDGQTPKRSRKSNDSGIINKSDKVLDKSEILSGTPRRSQNISNSKTSNLPKDDSVKSKKRNSNQKLSNNDNSVDEALSSGSIGSITRKIPYSGLKRNYKKSQNIDNVLSDCKMISNMLSFNKPHDGLQIQEDNKNNQYSKLKKPKLWITDNLYNFIILHINNEYRIRTRKRAEEFVLYLVDKVTVVTKEKTDFKKHVDELKFEMARLKLIDNLSDFYNFIRKFLPHKFHVKSVPMFSLGGGIQIVDSPRPGTLYDKIL